MGKGYHFFQRVDRHKDQLKGKEAEVERVVKNAVKGISRISRIHIHPTHFHVFTSLDEKRKLKFISRIREEISCLEGVKWDTEYYLTPVSSLSREYVSRLLRDLHKGPPL